VGFRNYKLIIPLMLALVQGGAQASTPNGAEAPKELAGDAHAAPMLATEGKEEKAEAAPNPWQERLGEAAANHLKAMAADTEARMAGYKEDVQKLKAGVFYPNAYAMALQDKKNPAMFDWHRSKGNFYHGHAPVKSFSKVPSPMSATGYTLMEFILKSGILPSAALDSFTTELSLLDCGASVMIAFHQALRSELGSEKFDALFSAAGLTPLRIGGNAYRHLPINALLRLVPDGAPLARGQMVHFKGIPSYPEKHINGEAANFNVICSDASTPGCERFAGLGLSGDGVDLGGLNQVFVDEYNAAPIGWEMFDSKLAGSIKASYPASDLLQAQALATHQITRGEFAKLGGARVAERIEFHSERVAALAAVSIPEACALLASWHR